MHKKRFAVVNYGLSKDNRLKGIKIFGCDISNQPGYKVLGGNDVFPGYEVLNHGLKKTTAAAIFDIGDKKPKGIFVVCPAVDEGVNNFLRVIPDWIISNLVAPLRDEKGEYILRFNNQRDIEVIYIKLR